MITARNGVGATLILIFSLGAALVPGRGQAQNLLDNPMDVVYDSARDRYLAANYGDGRIVQIYGNA